MKATGTDDIRHEDVLAAALDLFTGRGFSETRLEDIAAEAGVTKRQLTYNFGDKISLYRETLRYALNSLHPDRATIRSSAELPVDALRETIGKVFDRYEERPTSARLITMENLRPVLGADQLHGLSEQSPAVMELDRILLQGRDYGAFRTDVSALDIYFLTAAMCIFPTLGEPVFHQLYGLPLTSAPMGGRLKALISDALVGFLTSVGDHGHGGSYTVARATDDAKLDRPLADSVYGEEDIPSDEVTPDFADIYEE